MNAVITPKQSNFNYRLSRARMVTEGTYGQLKGRWRVLLRKSKENIASTRFTQEKIASTILTCMVLHNICINQGDTIPRALDITIDPATNGRRDRARVRELLQMRSCEKMRDTSHQADKIRNALTEKLWLEKQGGEVC